MATLNDLSTAALRTFATIVDLGTIEAAAHRLGITASAVSQRLKALETQAGTVLLLRTKPVEPTQVGRIIYRLARQYQVAMHDAQEALDRRTRVRDFTRVTLVVTADALATWITTALEGVAGEHKLLLSIIREDESRAATLVRDGTAMAAVSASPEPAPGISVTELGTWRYWAVAHPQFIRRYFPSGMDRRAVGRAPLLRYDDDDRMPVDLIARTVGPGTNPPTHFLPESRQMVLACARQLGWTMVSRELRALVPGAAGLVPVPGTEPVDVRLYWQQWAMSSPTLDAIQQAVGAAARRASSTPGARW